MVAAAAVVAADCDTSDTNLRNLRDIWCESGVGSAGCEDARAVPADGAGPSGDATRSGDAAGPAAEAEGPAERRGSDHTAKKTSLVTRLVTRN